jgi:hypothetical protein
MINIKIKYKNIWLPIVEQLIAQAFPCFMDTPKVKLSISTLDQPCEQSKNHLMSKISWSLYQSKLLGHTKI